MMFWENKVATKNWNIYSIWKKNEWMLFRDARIVIKQLITMIKDEPPLIN